MKNKLKGIFLFMHIENIREKSNNRKSASEKINSSKNKNTDRSSRQFAVHS